jgi:hypothetical protein
VFIPEVWSKELQRATESNLVAARLVKRFDSEVQNVGQIIHIPKISNLSANVKSANTQVTLQSPTETKLDLTVNKHYEASFLIEDYLEAEAAYRIQEEYKEKAAYALAKQVDTDILALNTGITQSVGVSGVPPTDLNFLQAIQLLDSADAPAQDRAFIMKPSLKATLLAIDKYVNQDFTGMGDVPVKTGLFGQRYGVLFYVSTNIPVDANGNPINQLIQKEAYCAALQKNITVKTDYILEYLGQLYVSQVLYGVLGYRPTFACLVLSA